MNHHDVNGRIRAGEVEMEIHCDTTQLDEALRKMELLITKATQAQSLGVLPMGILATALLVGSPVDSRDGISFTLKLSGEI